MKMKGVCHAGMGPLDLAAFGGEKGREAQAVLNFVLGGALLPWLRLDNVPAHSSPCGIGENHPQPVVGRGGSKIKAAGKWRESMALQIFDPDLNPDSAADPFRGDWHRRGVNSYDASAQCFHGRVSHSASRSLTPRPSYLFRQV